MVRKLMLGAFLGAVLSIPGMAIASSVNAAVAPESVPAQAATPCAASVSPTGPTTVVTTDANQFAPKTITVPVGSSVTFDNNGTAAHTATADPGAGTWDSGPLLPGSCFTTPAFSAAGTFTYYCLYHKALGMVGTITVGSGTAAAGAASPTPAASPSPTGPPLSGLPTPAPAPTAPPSQKYFTKIGGILVVVLIIAVLLGYRKMTKKLADKG